MSHSIAQAPTSGTIYTRAFWLVFAANFFLCSANTLTFRFAEFVTFLGGNEEATGRIVAAGLIASLVWRAFLGQAIDRFGVRNVWLVSTLIYLTGVGLLVVTKSINWQIYVARATFIIGLASMFSCALSYVQSLAPANRRTEIIATFGAAGFLGMIAGAQLGDLLFRLYPNSQTLFQVLFTLTMLLGGMHGFLAIFLTGGPKHARPSITPAAHQLFKRYFPRQILVVAAVMGLVVAVTTVFLTRFATERGIGGLRTYFTAYAVMAFITRMASRNWSRQAGRHRLITYGMISQIIAMLALIPVTRDWQFIPAAVMVGFGQALLFPCVVSLSTEEFPEQYRGTATTITLSMIDLGSIVAAPILGFLIDRSGFELMLIVTSIVVAVCCLVYGVSSWSIRDVEGDEPAPMATHLTEPLRVPVATSAPMAVPVSLSVAAEHSETERATSDVEEKLPMRQEQLASARAG
jgi:MFS family permease